MAFDSIGINEGVASWLTDRFEDAPGQLLEDTSSVLKDGFPVVIENPYVIPAIGIEIGRRACRRYADNADVFDSESAASFERLCRPYLDDIGYGGRPSIRLPFRGGQCYGVTYRVVTAFTNPPIGAQTNEQLVNARVVGTFRGSRQPNQLTPVGIELQAVEGGEISRVTIAALSDDDVGSFRIASVSREDGLPDDCGNPTPVVEPPSPDPSPDPPGPAPFNPSPDIDIDIDVTVPVIVGVGPVIVFDIGVGPVVVDLFPDGDGDGGGGDGGGDPSDGPPGDVGQPSEPDDTGEDGTAAGCAPEGSVIVGVKVDVLGVPEFSSEYDPLVRRGVCYAYFGVPGNLALEPSGVALRSGQFLFAPKNNLTCYEVRANTGYNLRVTPYYRALESEES